MHECEKARAVGKSKRIFVLFSVFCEAGGKEGGWLFVVCLSLVVVDKDNHAMAVRKDEGRTAQ